MVEIYIFYVINISIRNYILIYNSSIECHDINNRYLTLGFIKKLLIEIFSEIIRNNNINIRKEVKIIKEIHIFIPIEKGPKSYENSKKIKILKKAL